MNSQETTLDIMLHENAECPILGVTEKLLNWQCTPICTP